MSFLDQFIEPILGIGFAAAVVAFLAWFFVNFKNLQESSSALAKFTRKLFEPRKASDWPRELSSRFAISRGMLADVLELRRRVFDQVLKKPLVSSDDSYWDAWERNRCAFSIVSEKGIAIGYWGLIPVSKENYDEFIGGGLSHSQMLSDAALAWEDVDPDNVYLYYVGVVALNRGVLTEDEPRIFDLEYKVTMDSLAVLQRIVTSCSVKGVAVYASTKFGWKLCENKLLKNGFEETGIFADKDRITEILVLPEKNVAKFADAMEALQTVLKGAGPRLLARAAAKQPQRGQEEMDAFLAAIRQH